MFEYFCPKCNKVCDNDEIELKEDVYDGEWSEYHLECGTQVNIIFADILID